MDLKFLLVKGCARTMELEVEAQQEETTAERFRDMAEGVEMDLKSLLVKGCARTMELEVEAQW